MPTYVISVDFDIGLVRTCCRSLGNIGISAFKHLPPFSYAAHVLAHSTTNDRWAQQPVCGDARDSSPRTLCTQHAGGED